ncbi:YggT family protein [Clostridium sp.]|uniref:YggT family protein n=1 Tax=Clostridium sp. TaxID=1506 RepID=UPI00290C4240|nr:YggT family protein [Clostridium sp.]MDU4476145.1 YggT family protein [Clostridium sp.]
MASIIIRLMNTVFGIIELAILIECIASWIPQLRYNKFMDIVYAITNPILTPFRSLQDRFFPDSPIDFSPIIALFVIDFVLRQVINRILYMLLW